MNDKVFKIIGLVTTVAGIAVDAIAGWASSKQMDSQITEEVNKAVQEALKNVKEP